MMEANIIRIQKRKNPFVMIEALKKLDPKKYELAINIRDMLSSLQNARRSVNQFRYYQPVFDLLLKDYRLNLKQRPLLTYREWFCFLLMALHDYRFEVIAWVRN